MKHYLINKITLEFPKGTSKKRQKSILDELKSRVYSDTSKSSLCYFLAEEMQEKNINIMDIKLKDITP